MSTRVPVSRMVKIRENPCFASLFKETNQSFDLKVTSTSPWPTTSRGQRPSPAATDYTWTGTVTRAKGREG